MQTITSRANDTIKAAVRLREQASARREEGLFFLEGARLCADAAQHGITLDTVFVTQAALDKYPQAQALCRQAKHSYFISDSVAAALSDTRSPQGIFCLGVIPAQTDFRQSLDANGRYLALDALQDPRNLGSICRSAKALGLTGLIVSGGCDSLHPAVLRASMGAALRLPVLQTPELPALLLYANKAGMQTLAAVPDIGAADVRSIAPTGGWVCVVGNEGNGICAAVQDACTQKITIPMPGETESLNAAAAAAVLIWELTRHTIK